MSALALARGGVCGASRDEVPTGALVGASSAAADRATVVCARAIALPELKSSCATVLVGIHGPQRAPSAPYKALNTQAIHCEPKEPHEPPRRQIFVLWPCGVRLVISKQRDTVGNVRADAVGCKKS